MEKREELKEQLKKFMGERGISANRVSLSLGLSSAVLSQYLKGVYQGDNSRVDEAVQDLLERERERRQMGRREMRFVETQEMRRIFEAMRIAHLEGEIAVVYGDAGCGKTTAVKHYAARYKDVILVEADLGLTAKILFKELHKRVGFDGKGSVHDMFEDVVSRLAGTGRMLVIDEAEHLPYRALELVRRLYDKSGIAVALVGMPRLVFNLRGKRGEYAQLYSRVGVACKVNGLSEDDTELIVGEYLPGTNGVWMDFFRFSNQNARHLTKLIHRAARIAEINERQVDGKVVKAAAEMLLI